MTRTSSASTWTAWRPFPGFSRRSGIRVGWLCAIRALPMACSTRPCWFATRVQYGPKVVAHSPGSMARWTKSRSRCNSSRSSHLHLRQESISARYPSPAHLATWISASNTSDGGNRVRAQQRGSKNFRFAIRCRKRNRRSLPRADPLLRAIAQSIAMVVEFCARAPCTLQDHVLAVHRRFSSIRIGQPQPAPTFMAEVAQCRDVAVVDDGRIGKCGHGTIDAGLAQQVQHRMW